MAWQVAYSLLRKIQFRISVRALYFITGPISQQVVLIYRYDSHLIKKDRTDDGNIMCINGGNAKDRWIIYAFETPWQIGRPLHRIGDRVTRLKIEGTPKQD